MGERSLHLVYIIDLLCGSLYCLIKNAIYDTVIEYTINSPLHRYLTTPLWEQTCILRTTIVSDTTEVNYFAEPVSFRPVHI